MENGKLRYTVEQINNKLDRIEIPEGVDQTLDSIDRDLDGRLGKVETELSLVDGSFWRIQDIETELDKDSEGKFWRIANIETELGFNKQIGSENNSRLDDLESRKLDIIENTEKKTLQVYAQTTDDKTTLIDVSINDAVPNSIVQRSSSGYICAKDYVLKALNGIKDNDVNISTYMASVDAELDDLAGNLGTIIETIGIDSSGGSAGENSIMERLATTEGDVKTLQEELGYTPNSGPRLERIEDIENTIYALDTAVKSLQPTSDFIIKVRESGGAIDLDLNKNFHREWYLYKVLVTSDMTNVVDMLQFVQQIFVSDPDREAIDYVLTNGRETYYGSTNVEESDQSIKFYKEL